MNRHPWTKQEQYPELIWEDRLVRYHHQRIRGKIIISAIGLFSLLLLCVYHLVFGANCVSGKVPATHEGLTKKQNTSEINKASER